MRRISALAALAAGVWLLAAFGSSRPTALGPDAPVGQFSASRADAVLGRLVKDQHPRPVASAEDTAMRGRILQELDALGVRGRTATQISCVNEGRYGVLSCGSVTNIVAQVTDGPGKQIVLMAHADSVAAGPGAGDDASGVATILETLRALKARGGSGHPIRALFTDGEEAGLLGAAAYLRDPDNRASTGAVINMEARGNRGPSYLFQTGPGDARLVDLYAHAVTHYAASSLYAEIYKVLPNDTDMTPFLGAGITGANFAFIGNGGQYHTPLDRRENIDPRTLQQHGENALGMAEALRHADLASLKSANAIYLDVLGRWLPRLPASWSLALSLFVFVLLGWAARREGGRFWRGLLMPLLLLGGAMGMGFVLHGLAGLIAGEPDPSFAHPLALRLSLAFGAFGVALLAARGAKAAASWLWLAGLAIVCAIWAPGIVPYFLFPCFVAAPLLLWRGTRDLALLVAAIAGLVVWLSFNQGSEAIMGLRLHPLFMVSAAFALVTLLPLLAKARNLGTAGVLSLVLAIVLSVVAGLRPAYSDSAPERLNLGYVEGEGKAWWLADPVPRLPQALRATADFSLAPQALLHLTRGYVAPAGAARHPVPQATVARNGNSVTLDLKAEGDGVILILPATAKLRRATVGGLAMPVREGTRSITCATPDCTHARFVLELESSDAFDLLLAAYSRGLPPEGGRLLKARPSWAVPSYGGDRSVWTAKIAVPGRP